MTTEGEDGLSTISPSPGLVMDHEGEWLTDMATSGG